MTEVLVVEPVMVEQLPAGPYPVVEQPLDPGIYAEAGYGVGAELPGQTAGEYLGSVAMVDTIAESRPSQEPLGTDFQAWEAEQETTDGAAELVARREDRFLSLIDLEHGNTFPSDRTRYEAANLMAATGMPVDNVRRLRYEANRRGTEDVLASFGVGFFNRGEYTVYDLLGRVVPEKRFGTHMHELSHAASPLRRENSRYYGGEDGRRQAERQVVGIAEQSRLTGIHLNGYHKFLLEQLSAGTIDLDTYNEETWAITAEMAMTKRDELARVEADQHRRVQDLQRSGELSQDYQAVNLVSHEDREGDVTVDGVDGLLIGLMDGVDDYAGLLAHAGRLKAEFYPAGSREVANDRAIRRYGRPLVEVHDEDDDLSDAERRRRGLLAGRTALALAV